MTFIGAHYIHNKGTLIFSDSSITGSSNFIGRFYIDKTYTTHSISFAQTGLFSTLSFFTTYLKLIDSTIKHQNSFTKHIAIFEKQKDFSWDIYKLNLLINVFRENNKQLLTKEMIDHELLCVDGKNIYFASMNGGVAQYMDNIAFNGYGMMVARGLWDNLYKENKIVEKQLPLIFWKIFNKVSKLESEYVKFPFYVNFIPQHNLPLTKLEKRLFYKLNETISSTKIEKLEDLENYFNEIIFIRRSHVKKKTNQKAKRKKQ